MLACPDAVGVGAQGLIAQAGRGGEVGAAGEAGAQELRERVELEPGRLPAGLDGPWCRAQWGGLAHDS